MAGGVRRHLTYPGPKVVGSEVTPIAVDSGVGNLIRILQQGTIAPGVIRHVALASCQLLTLGTQMAVGVGAQPGAASRHNPVAAAMEPERRRQAAARAAFLFQSQAKGAPMLGNINPGALTNGRTLTCAPVHDAAVHPRSSDDPKAADPTVYAASHSRWLIVLFLSVIVAALGWAIGSSVFQAREVPPVIVLDFAGFVGWLWHYHASQLAIEITLWPDTGQIRFHAPLGYRETNICRRP